MDKEFINYCFGLCGVKVEEEFLEKHPDKVIKALKEFNENEDVRFDLKHSFQYNEKEPEISVIEENLKLLDVARKLLELNNNISSYEYYFSKARKHEE